MTKSAILAQHHLLEAKRIFVDAEEAGEAILPGLYNLLCDIFESTNFASNSATFNGLISALNELPEAQTLHLYYFHNMSLSQIASLSSSNESLGATTLSRKRALKQLFNCAHNFYLPERQNHLERYNKFLAAVLIGSPVDDDLSVKAIGLST